VILVDRIWLLDMAASGNSRKFVLCDVRLGLLRKIVIGLGGERVGNEEFL
jgi:hypothetical protein